MLTVAKHSSLASDFRHRIVSLCPADSHALKLSADAELETLDAPGKEIRQTEIRNADIVHLHFWNSPEIYELLRSELAPMRLLLWFHVAGDSPPQVITKDLINFADFALASSPYTLDLPVMQDLPFDVKAQKTDVVYSVADFARLSGLQPKPHAAFNVGYVGTVDFVKMHPRYVPMSASIEIPEVKFVVCGSGDGCNELKRQAQKLNVAERFDFHPYTENVKAIYETLDVFGYPLCENNYSTAELVLQEAMYAQAPPVIFAYGGAQRTVINNHTGLIVNSEAEYKQGVEFLYHQPEERVRLGRNAKSYVEEFFAAEKAAQRLNKIYGQLLRTPKRQRLWHDSFSDQIIWQTRTDTNEFYGAKCFVQSLGDSAPQFAVSLSSNDLEETLEAERRIAFSSPALLNPGGGGILHYRNFYPEDGYLRLWSGLMLRESKRSVLAAAEFDKAIRLGCDHWRVSWYLAQVAMRLGAVPLAAEALRRVAQAAPRFAPAREILSSMVESDFAIEAG